MTVYDFRVNLIQGKRISLSEYHRKALAVECHLKRESHTDEK